MRQTQCGSMTTNLQSIVSNQKKSFIRGLVIALCFFAGGKTSAATLSISELHALSQSKVWRTLLHSNGSKSFISDKRYFLYSGAFDPARELTKDIEGFSRSFPLNDDHPICRFPARFQWVIENTHLNPSDFPKPNCASYNEFMQKVPVDEIQLVFASENVLSPSSMMGHVFLKLSGKNSDQYLAEHAVTYFTLLGSLNVPKVIYQNLFGGMRGLFALQPYRVIKNNYLKKENRNIWEYSLKLNTKQKKFIRAHIWELKGMDSDYLFGDYNCSTITYFLLAMVFPEKLKAMPNWLSPLDVVKIVHKYDLVKSTQVATSDHWKIQMLKDQVNSSFDPTVISNIPQENIEAFLMGQSPVEKIYTQTYIHYLRDHNPEAYHAHQTFFDKADTLLRNDTQNYTLDYTDYKDPVKAPGAQHLQVSYGYYDQNKYIGLAFLPAAIRLTDDQRQYFATRELRMFEVSARIFANGRVQPQDITLYAVKSLNPWNSITKSFSGQWKLNGENHFDKMLRQHFVLNGSAGLGYTLDLLNDISVSGLYNIGAGSDFKNTYLYHFPEVTIQANEIGNMKTIATFAMNFHMYNSSIRNDTLEVCQSYFHKNSTTFLACGKRTKNRLVSRDEFQLSFEKNF